MGTMDYGVDAAVETGSQTVGKGGEDRMSAEWSNESKIWLVFHGMGKAGIAVRDGMERGLARAGIALRGGTGVGRAGIVVRCGWKGGWLS